MARLRTSMNQIMSYAKYINKLSKRRIKFGQAITKKRTKSHAQVKKVKSLLQDAYQRITQAEKVNATRQYAEVVMDETGDDITLKELHNYMFKMGPRIRAARKKKAQEKSSSDADSDDVEPSSESNNADSADAEDSSNSSSGIDFNDLTNGTEYDSNSDFDNDSDQN